MVSLISKAIWDLFRHFTWCFLKRDSANCYPRDFLIQSKLTGPAAKYKSAVNWKSFCHWNWIFLSRIVMKTKTTPSSLIFYLLVVNSSRELDHLVSFLFQSLHLVISNLSPVWIGRYSYMLYIMDITATEALSMSTLCSSVVTNVE